MFYSLAYCWGSSSSSLNNSSSLDPKVQWKARKPKTKCCSMWHTTWSQLHTRKKVAWTSKSSSSDRWEQLYKDFGLVLLCHLSGHNKWRYQRPTLRVVKLCIQNYLYSSQSLHRSDLKLLIQQRPSYCWCQIWTPLSSCTILNHLFEA